LGYHAIGVGRLEDQMRVGISESPRYDSHILMNDLAIQIVGSYRVMVGASRRRTQQENDTD
jgi:hypothetical protein